MKQITVADVIEVCHGKMEKGDPKQVLTHFSKDTRTLQKGDVYIGLKGENFDGSLYAKEAMEKGAIACIVGETVDPNVCQNYDNVIIVADTLKAIQDLAHWKRSFYSIPVIAVAGSVGKTSTKDLIAGVLATKYRVYKTEGNHNNHIGLPLTILSLTDEDVLVVEMGMNHFGEMRVLTNIANPTMVAFTNIGTTHIGNLGSRENILKAKMEILEGMPKDGTIVINEDNDLLQAWGKQHNQQYHVVTYGIEQPSDYQAKHVSITENETTYEVNQEKIILHLPGKAFVYNSLCAIAVADQLQVSMKKIQQGLQKVELTKKRMEIVEKDGVKIINDAYNSSFDSLKAGIEYLHTMQGKRKIAVLGDMLELGEYSQTLHEKIATVLQKNQIDILITVGKQAEYIAKKAKELKLEAVYECSSNQEAIAKIQSIRQEGDIILVKASHSMKFDEIVKAIA